MRVMIMGAGAKANRSGGRVVARSSSSLPQKSRNQVPCCVRRNIMPPPLSFELAAFFCVLCLVFADVAHCQSSPLLPHALRRGQQDLPSFTTEQTLQLSSSLSSSSSSLSLPDGMQVRTAAPRGQSIDGGQRRDTVPVIRYTNATMLRKNALVIYRSFCPDFVWKKGGCDARSVGEASVRWSRCGHWHVLERDGVAIAPRQTTFQYAASRDGVPYGRRLSIVCPHGKRTCSVLNLWCEDGAAPSKAPTRRPARPPPRPTRAPSPAPTPSTRTCASCLTQQNWTCAYAETCGCNVNNCLAPGAPPPVCSCRTMVPVPWNANRQATIELCQDLTNSSVYGYRLPGEDGCHLAALMIRVVPGNQYRLTIRNRSNGTSTNLHTHGLHISGDGNADNPMRVVSPGNCITYHWDIPANHMGGTHWMHSHDMEHGYDQVRGGALAMFIVEENPTLLDNVDAASRPGITAWLQNELLLVATQTLAGHRGNGLANAQLNMTAGEWYRLRILGAEVDGNDFGLRLPFLCTLHTVAHDGVWLFAVPSLASPPEEAEYRMTPSGRLDLAIRCPRAGSFPITAVSTEIPNSVIATVNVRAGTPSIATPFTSAGLQWAPSRPSYLQDLLHESVAVDNLYNISISLSSINGIRFQMENPPLETFAYGSVQEWTIKNAARPHSYHQHVHHFQVVSCPGFESGEFYDTIMPTEIDSNCVVRQRVKDYSGNLFVHCHKIAHSEMGAMARFHVTDGGIVNGNEDYDEFVC